MIHAVLRSSLSIAALLVVTLSQAQHAAAQAPAPTERFSVNRFTPAPGPNNYFATDGAMVHGHLVPGGGLMVDFGHRPFSLYGASCQDEAQEDCSVEDRQVDLVSYQLNFDLWGSLIISDRIQVGLVVPLSLVGGDPYSRMLAGSSIQYSGGTTFAVGDPTLSVKARLFGEGQGLHVGLAVWGRAPVAHHIAGDSFIGDESLSIGGHFIVQFVQNGLHLAANLGGFYRPERTFLSTTSGSQLTYRAAVGYEITPLIMVFGEIDGAFGLSNELDENPLEARLGGRMRVGDLTFSLGAGPGIISGVGVPTVRVLAGVAYAPERGDRDGDGIDDSEDNCPTEPEDRDQWEDEDGCPEADNDQDGKLDGEDSCPNQAEDLDQHEDDDGCPDDDNDGDGIRDGFDSCPNDAEDMDGDRDEDGCPDDDTDRDGIDDVADQCPNEAEDADGFGDEDGCPEDDFDGDGIPDDGDECPDQAEIMNGVDDEDGCPEPDDDHDGIANAQDQCPDRAETLDGRSDDDGCPDGAAVISLGEREIIFTEPVHFARRGRVRGRAALLLGTLGTLLVRNPGVRLEITVGAASAAEAQQRADAIQATLTESGIAESRIRYVPTEGADGLTLKRLDVAAAPATPARAPAEASVE